MYILLNNTYSTISDLLNLKDILGLIIFLILVFLGVSTRIGIEIELNKSKLRDIRFFNRYFLAGVLSYILKCYLAESHSLQKYYSEVIILFCIFVNDIIEFLFENKSKILLYLLSALTTGIMDLKKVLLTNATKKKKNGTTGHHDSESI